MKRLLLIPVLLVVLVACSQGSKETLGMQMEWTAVDSLNEQLPPGIRVFETRHTEENLRAWYVWVQESSSDIETRVVMSQDTDARETISDFAERLQVPVMINGGYFRMDKNPATHVGILKIDGELIHSATTSVLRGEQRFYVNRAALALGEDDLVEVAWVSTNSDTVFKWERAIQNYPDEPGAQLSESFRQVLTARDVLGGGPLLIKDGQINISVNEEVFFGTSIPDVHPRTAAGITSGGDLILLLVDGRQLVSRGVNLNELAEILLGLGCVDALNLDGGGSSALVVNGILLNKPAGTTDQREVMSALAVFAR